MKMDRSLILAVRSVETLSLISSCRVVFDEGPSQHHCRTSTSC